MSQNTEQARTGNDFFKPGILGALTNLAYLPLFDSRGTLACFAWLLKTIVQRFFFFPQPSIPVLLSYKVSLPPSEFRAACCMRRAGYVCLSVWCKMKWDSGYFVAWLLVAMW